MKKILIWLAGLALLIAGCSATLNPKQQPLPFKHKCKKNKLH